MNYRVWLISSLLVLPLCGWQVSDKPSPVPHKSRKSSPGNRTVEKSSPLPAGRAKTNVRTESEQPSAGGAALEQTGKACFFSSRANGGLTASGRRLNSEELVAGHATYPLGSRVKITNLANRKTIEVLIVDRFPASGRIINVSEAVARQLDFIKAGTADVRLDLVQQADGHRDRQ